MTTMRFVAFRSWRFCCPLVQTISGLGCTFIGEGRVQTFSGLGGKLIKEWQLLPIVGLTAFSPGVFCCPRFGARRAWV